MKRILSLFFLLLAGHGLACAAPDQDWARRLATAQAALAARDYPTAYTRYQKQAKDNPLAQFTLGLFYREGWGRDKNPVAACGWFEKAAGKHIPAAEHFWGDCLAQGIGRAVDIPGALAWYDKAATHGHLISWCAAADYYIQGKGVDRDAARGLALCTQAAQANSPPAMLKVADYHRNGGTVPQDLPTARYWYQQAAERQIAEAQYRLGVMLAQGEGGAPDPEAALFWIESAASAGYAPAYLPTAILYANAPVQADTGALAPEHLAKIYLWNSAAKARATDPAQLAEIARIESMVLAIMPAAWYPDLDKKVAEHLSKHDH